VLQENRKGRGQAAAYWPAVSILVLVAGSTITGTEKAIFCAPKSDTKPLRERIRMHNLQSNTPGSLGHVGPG
jgi:hypothetical protein